MEVHHPKVKNKKFKEYFLEFLMIFLAVTLGFFAEQIRERFAEKTKEKEYMREIIENLKYDITRCANNVRENVQIQQGLDSLKTELKNAVNGRVNSNALYYYTLKYTGNFGQVAFNTSAINELKNSGSLRLIEKRQLLGEISDYYERKIFAAQYFMPSVNHMADLKKMQNEFFSLINLDDYVEAYDHISDKTYDIIYNYQSILGRQPALQLLNTRPPDLEKFYTLVSQHQMEVARYKFWILYCKKAAEKLINDIQTAYHLKNE